MKYRDLRDFIADLERRGELKRISASAATINRLAHCPVEAVHTGRQFFYADT